MGRKRCRNDTDTQPALTHHSRTHSRPSFADSSSAPHPSRPQQRGTANQAAQHSPYIVYSPSDARWTALDPSSLSLDSPTTLSSLSCLTYNTFSSSPTHSPAQSRALLRVLRRAAERGSHVIALQEVSSAFFSRLTSEPWVKENWATTTPEGFWKVAGHGGKGPKSKEGEREACVLLVKKEVLGRGSSIDLVKLPRARDEQGKAVIVAKLRNGGRERIRILTSHFTSLPENASIRASQYRQCLSLLSRPSSSPSSSSSSSRQHHPHLLLLGDFNASSELELQPLLSSSLPGGAKLRDCCPLAFSSSSPTSSSTRLKRLVSSSSRSLHSTNAEQDDHRFRHPPTFGHLYPFVAPSSRKPRKSRRIDRVYASFSPSSSESLEVKEYEHLGAEPLEGERDRLGRNGRAFASDHEAVRVRVRWRTDGEQEGKAEGETGGSAGREEGDKGDGHRKKRRKKRRKKQEDGAAT
ncbi:hypothetical protein JCM8547_002473 [Rhodosporidiobolus lusitaniae]